VQGLEISVLINARSLLNAGVPRPVYVALCYNADLVIWRMHTLFCIPRCGFMSIDIYFGVMVDTVISHLIGILLCQ